MISEVFALKKLIRSKETFHDPRAPYCHWIENAFAWHGAFLHRGQADEIFSPPKLLRQLVLFSQSDGGKNRPQTRSNQRGVVRLSMLQDIGRRKMIGMDYAFE